MRFSEATVLVTGGTAGIGRGLAEALVARGARAIITGRDPERLQRALDANPSMIGYRLDVSDPAGVEGFASLVAERHPELDVLINNAGFMAVEDLGRSRPSFEVVERTIATNLLGPMRLTSALLPHLLSRSQACVVNVSSGLAFVPRADAPTYGATKAALHSWTQSLRHQLRHTAVEVVELVPPLVATNFAPGQVDNQSAMPLEDFVLESVDLLCADPTPGEVLVARVLRQRMAERTGRYDDVFAAINPG